MLFLLLISNFDRFEEILTKINSLTDASEDTVAKESFEAGNGVESQQTFGRSNPPTFSLPQIKLV